MARPRTKQQKSKPQPEAAFFPQVKGRWSYVFTDGEKEWLPVSGTSPVPARKGKFSFSIGQSEVLDDGFQVTRINNFTVTESERFPAWARVTWLQAIDRASYQRVGCVNWRPITQMDSAQALAAPLDWMSKTDNELKTALCKNPPFPVLPSDAVPRRVVWWIRHGNSLARVNQSPADQERLVATVHHFCPAPGAIVRVEIVTPFTPEEGETLLKSMQPPTFTEQLEQMRLQIADFKDIPQQITDPQSTEARIHIRLNPVWEHYNSAGVALKKLQMLLSHKPKDESIEQREALMEQIARQALTLGQKSTLLFISPKIPILRKREKMDEHSGRPPENPKIREAVVEFVSKYSTLKAGSIFSRLCLAAQSGRCPIGWNEQRDVFQHEAEEKPAWSKSTMFKELRKALGEVKKTKKKMAG